MSEFKFIGMLALLVAMTAILATSNVSADVADDSEDLNVSVEVASQTWIDIAPDHIRWYNVNPGADSTNFTDEERGTTNHEGIVIRNIGSTDIKTVWFNASYPSSLPYGTGTLGNYDTANFVLLSQADIDGNNSDQTDLVRYYYINKKEYPEAERSYIDADTYDIVAGRNIPYLQTMHPETSSDKNVTIGRLRDGENEYFWALLENDNSDCNRTAGSSEHPTFRIGLAPHNETYVGDIDLTAGCEAGLTCEEITTWNGQGDDYYYGVLDLDSNRWKGAVVKLDIDCQGITFVTWNKDLAMDTITNPADNSANYWLANATSYSGSNFPQGVDLGDDSRSTEVLAPGEYYTGWLKLRLPWGIPAGYLDTGTITVLVSTNSPA